MTALTTNPFAIPPHDMVMPENAQFWLTVAWGTFAALTVLMCIVKGVKAKSWLPICLVIGSALSMFGEAVVIPNMNYWYPEIGQINAYRAYGQSIPLFAGFAYVFYFAPAMFFMISEFDKGISAKKFVILSAAMWAGTIGYEIATVGTGVCIYYGDQYFKIGGLPLVWPTLNSMIIIVASVLLFFARPFLKGWTVLLVIPYMAVQIATVEVLVGYPAFVTNNADVPGFVRMLSVVMSFGMCASVVWISSRLVCSRAADKFRGLAWA